MGDIIRDVAEIEIVGNRYKVELNHSTRGSEFRDIHIQNEKVRIEMPENEFLQMAACVLLAKRQLDIIKGVGDE